MLKEENYNNYNKNVTQHENPVAYRGYLYGTIYCTVDHTLSCYICWHPVGGVLCVKWVLIFVETHTYKVPFCSVLFCFVLFFITIRNDLWTKHREHFTHCPCYVHFPSPINVEHQGQFSHPYFQGQILIGYFPSPTLLFCPALQSFITVWTTGVATERHLNTADRYLWAAMLVTEVQFSVIVALWQMFHRGLCMLVCDTSALPLGINVCPVLKIWCLSAGDQSHSWQHEG